MFYVYLLRDRSGKLYVGYSGDLKRRVAEHLQGKVYTSSRMHSPKLVYYEAYTTEAAAKVRERKLKQYGSAYQGLLKRFKFMVD